MNDPSVGVVGAEVDGLRTPEARGRRRASAPVNRVHIPSRTFYGHMGDVRYPDGTVE